MRVNNALTPEVWKALVATSSDAAVGEYRVSKDDLKGPFLQKLPAKMEEMKSLPFLGYTSPREAIAEKFHMSEELLAALNPGKKFDRADEIILVANVAKERRQIEGGPDRGQQIKWDSKGFYPFGRACSVLPSHRRKRGKTCSERDSQSDVI